MSKSSKCYVVYKKPRQSFEEIIIDIFSEKEPAEKQLDIYEKYSLHDCYTYHMKEYDLK